MAAIAASTSFSSGARSQARSITARHVPGLYHIGASTHPGPGLGGGSGFLLANAPEMNDRLNLRAPDAAFEDPLWLRGASAAGLRPIARRDRPAAIRALSHQQRVAELERRIWPTRSRRTT